MPRCDFKFPPIFLELFIFEKLKNQVPLYHDSWELKIEPETTHTSNNFKIILLGSVLYAWLIFGFDVPLRQRESVIFF